LGDSIYFDALKNDSLNPPAGPLALLSCTNYAFSHLGSGTGSDTVQNVNTFKKITGVFGQVVTSSNGSPVPNVVATLKTAAGAVVATGVTDIDGFYSLAYKHTGKAANFTVILGTVQKVVTLKANGWAEVDYDPTTNTWLVDVSGTAK
jgi:hypothetical protein